MTAPIVEAADDDELDGGAERRNRSIARAAEQRAKVEAANRKAGDIVARRNLRRREVAEAVVEQGLTDEDLRECIELGNDFRWEPPLSLSAAVAYLERQRDAVEPSLTEAA